MNSCVINVPTLILPCKGINKCLLFQNGEVVYMVYPGCLGWFGSGGLLGGGIGMVIMMIVWIAVLVGIVWFIIWAVQRTGSMQGGNALETLKNRYAKGEISKKEYEDMKKELRN